MKFMLRTRVRTLHRAHTCKMLKHKTLHPNAKWHPRGGMDKYYEEFWDDLFHVLADPQKAKVLAHADKPTTDMIRKQSDKMIADFRKDNLAALRATNREFVLLCRELSLLGDSRVAIDGAFLKANVSPGSIHTKARLERELMPGKDEPKAQGGALGAYGMGGPTSQDRSVTSLCDLR